jgi:hypothetical protein
MSVDGLGLRACSAPATVPTPHGVQQLYSLQSFGGLSDDEDGGPITRGGRGMAMPPPSAAPGRVPSAPPLAGGPQRDKKEAGDAQKSKKKQVGEIEWEEFLENRTLDQPLAPSRGGIEDMTAGAATPEEAEPESVRTLAREAPAAAPMDERERASISFDEDDAKSAIGHPVEMQRPAVPAPPPAAGAPPPPPRMGGAPPPSPQQPPRKQVQQQGEAPRRRPRPIVRGSFTGASVVVNPARIVGRQGREITIDIRADGEIDWDPATFDIIFAWTDRRIEMKATVDLARTTRAAKLTHGQIARVVLIVDDESLLTNARILEIVFARWAFAIV